MSATDKRVILVTGANKGLGYEAIKQLSEHLPHATLLLATRSVENGHKAVARMREQHAKVDNVKVIELDVTRKESLKGAALQVQSAYGQLDVLVCNAGVSGMNGETDETVLSVNLDGVHDTIEAFLPILRTTGLITVVASEVGAWATHCLPAQLQERLSGNLPWTAIEQLKHDWIAYKRQQKHEQPWPPVTLATGAYGISKSLLLSWCRSYAREHTQHKLVVVCPGYCATDLNKNTGPRSAALGGSSIIWPILHSEAETGLFYQDGKSHPYVAPVPAFMTGQHLEKH